MDPGAATFIYCNYEQPAGVERVSLRLRDFLHRQDHSAELVSLFGEDVFGEETQALAGTDFTGRTIIFSRKGDFREIGRKRRGARLIYWRHVPVTQTGFRWLVEVGFIALMSRIGQVVCVCDDLAGDMVALPFVNRGNVTTCYSPIGPDMPARVTIRRPAEGPLRLVYFGRPGTQKRLDLVLWQVMAARARGQDVSLTVYGYDEIPVDTVPAGIEFAGSTSDPLAVLSAADAVILISEYEGFPTVMIEAALTGTPIIANAFRTGLEDFERLVGPVAVIDPEDEHALSAALANLPAGDYSLSALSDEQVREDWLRILADKQG